jgi:uncharacterized protein (TIGR02996 family)
VYHDGAARRPGKWTFRAGLGGKVMSTEAALIAACAANPRDGLPRLVYADWLDERNDPRGEMVRVMEELRLHPVWAEEYRRLCPARNRLWKSLDSAWLETMGYQKVYRPLFGELPKERKYRWRLAEEFIDIWHGGLKRGDGYSDEELDQAERQLTAKLPMALREWYQFAGKRGDIWSSHGELIPPDRLLLRSDRIVIRLEEDDERYWLIAQSDLALPDPKVYFDVGSWYRADSVSAFALMVLMSEVRTRSITCTLNPPAGERNTLPKRFRRAEIPGRNPHHYVRQFWEADDTILIGSAERAVVNCRTEAAYLKLVRDFGVRIGRLSPQGE